MNQQDEIMEFLAETQTEIKTQRKGTLYPRTIERLTSDVLRKLPLEVRE